MIPLAAIVYLVLCLMVGIFGSRTQLGFFRSIFFSVMVTPFVVMVYLLLFAKLDAEREREREREKEREQKKTRTGVPGTDLPPAKSSSAD